MNLLRDSLAGQGKYSEADPLLRKSYEGLRNRQSDLPPYLAPKRRIAEAMERLVQLYTAWGKADQSSEWKKKQAEFPVTAPRS